MRHLIPTLFGLILILVAGYATGRQTNRWGKDEVLQQAVDRLANIPVSFGDWDSSVVEMPQEQLTVAEAAGHFSRRYVNRQTGQTVSVMILCGRHGPISVHPPTVCFTSAGWRLDGESVRRTVTGQGGVEAECWVTDFAGAHSGVPMLMRTWWCWNPGTGWQAPERPRISFAGSPYLYKMYLVTDRPHADTVAEDNQDAAEALLKELLPHLQSALESTNATTSPLKEVE